MLQIPAAAHSAVGSTMGLLLERIGNHEMWSSQHDSFICFALFAVQTENSCKAQHTCIFFWPSAYRDSSELSISPTSLFRSVLPAGRAETFYCVPPEQLGLQSAELQRKDMCPGKEQEKLSFHRVDFFPFILLFLQS